MTSSMQLEGDAVVAAATAGDELAFSKLVSMHRGEVQRLAYRILGSREDSEDLTQETFLRAWRKRASFRGDSTFRSWLYRIATNACLTALERRAPRVPRDPGAADRGLEEIPAGDLGPDEEVAAKETLELAALAAVQHLPPKQRAVLFLRGVLGWSAKETAELLDLNVASVNSGLQRARVTLRKALPGDRLEWAPGWEPTEEERKLLRRCLAAAERADAQAFATMLQTRPRSSGASRG